MSCAGVEFRQGNGGRKSILRYPLRSASKLKEQAAKSPDAPVNSSSSKRFSSSLFSSISMTFVYAIS